MAQHIGINTDTGQEYIIDTDSGEVDDLPRGTWQRETDRARPDGPQK